MQPIDDHQYYDAGINITTNSKRRTNDRSNANWQSANSLYLPEIGLSRVNNAKIQYKKAFSTDSARLGASALLQKNEVNPKTETWKGTVDRPNPNFIGLNRSYGLKRNQSKSAGLLGIGLRNNNAFSVPQPVSIGNMMHAGDHLDANIMKPESIMRVKQKQYAGVSQTNKPNFSKDTKNIKSELTALNNSQAMMPSTTRQDDQSAPFYKLPRSPLLGEKLKPARSGFKLNASPEKAAKYANRLQPINQQIQAIQRDIDELDCRFQYYEAKIGRK